MESQEYSRRHFMEAVGAAALSAAATSYSYADDGKKPNDKKQKDNDKDEKHEEKKKDKEHKDKDLIIIEMLPQEAAFINLGAETRANSYKAKHEKTKVISPRHEHIQELEEILSDNENPEQISHEENRNQTAEQLFRKYSPSLATLLGFNKKGTMFVPQVGVFISPHFILTAYSNAQERIDGNTANISYVTFSEKNPHKLSNPLEISALNQESGLALLYTDEPNKQAGKLFPKIARDSPKPKEELYGLYRDFPAKDEEKTILSTGGKISPDKLIPVTPPRTLSLSPLGLVLANGYRYSVCIGYAVSIPKEITPANLREMDIEKLSPACVRRDMCLVGSPVFDKKHLVGILTMAVMRGNIDYITSPALARDFLEDYKADLKKK